MAIQNFFLLLFISIVRARTDCPTSYCDQNRISIRYPFWLQSQKQPHNSCMPQDFNLSCNSQKQAILNIPNSGEFYVSSIYYFAQRIILHDPDYCLPRRLTSLNLSSSPFMAVSYKNYTFLSCPKGQVSSNSVIDCLSNMTHDVLPTDEEYVMNSTCKKMFISVPATTLYDYGFPHYLELKWDVPTCKDCVSTTGSANEKPVVRIIALSTVIPALVIPAVIVCISCCICMLKPENPDPPGDSIHISGGAALSDRVAAGLDKSIVESFRKTTIVENSCIEGPNGTTCTICLAEYRPKDTIRFMPECEHCFRVECIDKWLSMNSMCPICRGSQHRNNSC